MYLNTPLYDYQYMCFNVKDVPPEVIKLYKLHDKITPDRWLNCKIQWAIYGLKEADKLANIQSQKVVLAWIKRYHIFTCSRQFWSKIYQPKRWLTSRIRHQEKLPNEIKLRWRFLLRNDTQMELQQNSQQKISETFNARISKKYH